MEGKELFPCSFSVLDGLFEGCGAVIGKKPIHVSPKDTTILYRKGEKQVVDAG